METARHVRVTPARVISPRVTLCGYLHGVLMTRGLIPPHRCIGAHCHDQHRADGVALPLLARSFPADGFPILGFVSRRINTRGVAG